MGCEEQTGCEGIRPIKRRRVQGEGESAEKAIIAATVQRRRLKYTRRAPWSRFSLRWEGGPDTKVLLVPSPAGRGWSLQDKKKHRGGNRLSPDWRKEGKLGSREHPESTDCKCKAYLEETLVMSTCMTDQVRGGR